MTMRDNGAAQTPVKEVVITREYAAPRELVFKVWTDPAHIAQWWGPRMFESAVFEWDARPGGAISLRMDGPEGMVAPMKGTFREVVPPERLVFTSTALEDEDGHPQLETLNTITFEEAPGGKTRLTVRATVVKGGPGAAEALAGMQEGWSQSLDKLGEHLVEAAG